MCHYSENEIGSRLLTRNSRKIAACYLKTFDPQKDSCKLIFTAIRFAKELNTINTRWTPFNLPHSVRTKTKLTREKKSYHKRHYRQNANLSARRNSFTRRNIPSLVMFKMYIPCLRFHLRWT